MIPANFASILVNHLWQSTVVAGVAWLLALALRKNQARTRYWVWMAASVKFLLPFALLIGVGERLRSLMVAPVAVQPALASVVDQITQPFPQAQSLDLAGPVVAAQRADLLPLVLLAIWACGALIVVARWTRGWLRIHAAMRAASPLTLAADVPVLSTSVLLEPGIFGIFRPVLLLPEGILHRLNQSQLDAIIAHEMCHVRRRDNLTFAAHMIVEALFWFFPPVWWIGARLIEERERACDEAVLQAGGKSEVYAEGILNVCKMYVESPLECAAGVSGSDLKKRIVRIMAEQVAGKLTLDRKVMLGAAGAFAVVLPLTLGLLRVSRVDAQTQPGIGRFTYDVSSIKPTPFRLGSQEQQTPNAYFARNVTLRTLMYHAYYPDILTRDDVVGLPNWAFSMQFDLEAKMDDATMSALQKLPQKEQARQRKLMLQLLLADRFQLQVHREPKERSVYELVIAKNGPRLTELKAGDTPGGVSMGQGQIDFRGYPIAAFAEALTAAVGRRVVDKTGLRGKYVFALTYAPDQLNGIESNAPSIFKALQEQLGLKLVPAKGLADVLVVDHVEKPSLN